MVRYICSRHMKWDSGGEAPRKGRDAYHDLDPGTERRHLVDGRAAAWAIGRNELAKAAMLQGPNHSNFQYSRVVPRVFL